MATRTANATWDGDLKQGRGSMRFGSGAFDGAYTYASRFEEGEGTNPEELIGAAQAGCFSMYLAGQLAEAGHRPERIETEARVTIRGGDGGPTITRIELATRGQVPGIDQATFERFAEEAGRDCPVSKALASVGERTVTATLEGA